MFSAVTYSLLEVSNFSWILYKLLGIDLKKVLSSALGFARFVSDESSLVEAQEGMLVRLMMFDSLILPILMIPVTYILMRRGTVQEKALSLSVVVTTILLSSVYIIAQRDLAMRKLMPVIPLMYILAFRSYEYIRENKKRTNLRKAWLVLKIPSSKL
jgi:hypothetical protein